MRQWTLSLLLPTTTLSLFLMACVQELSNTRPGMFLFESSHGLLIGSMQWRQGGRVIGRKVNLDLKNVLTGQDYFHQTHHAQFRLAVPEGTYSLSTLRIVNPRIRATLARRVIGTVPILLFLLNQYTMPYGLVISPSTDFELKTRPDLTTFSVERHQAIYVGDLWVEIPDPLPMGPIHPTIRVLEDPQFQTDQVRRQFPGIKGVARFILKPTEVAHVTPALRK